MAYDESAVRAKYAPTPTHGAAYAVAIQHVGGWNAIGDCSDQDKYAAMRARLDGLLAFARGLNDAAVLDAYEYGAAKVDADLRARLEVMQNARRVQAAMTKLPKP